MALRTKCVFKADTEYGNLYIVSGLHYTLFRVCSFRAVFRICQLESLVVTVVSMGQCNYGCTCSQPEDDKAASM